jgi:phage-related tail protein
MDTFGRSGADMATLLELPRDRLRELAEDADKVGLTMSGGNLQAAKDYAKSMDDLEDSLNGVKIEFGNYIIPYLNWFITNGSQVNKSIEDQKLKWMDLLPVLGAIRDVILWIQSATVGAGFAEKVSTYNPYLNESVNNKKLLGGYASGGSVFSSGLAWVGEQGPELVDLPGGSYVHSNAESKQMTSGGYNGPSAREIGDETALAIIKYGANNQQ